MPSALCTAPTASPCSSSQPSSARNPRCASVSTPSAMTRQLQPLRHRHDRACDRGGARGLRAGRARTSGRSSACRSAGRAGGRATNSRCRSRRSKRACRALRSRPSARRTSGRSSISMRSVSSISSHSPGTLLFGQHALDRLDETRRAELHVRQVHRHRQRRAPIVRRMPALGATRRFAQHPLADRQHQPMLLGHRDEGVGREQAARRDAASGSAPRRRLSTPSRARTCGWNCSTNSSRANACASSLSVTSAA